MNREAVLYGCVCDRTMKLLERGLDLYKINEIEINVRNKWKWEWLDKTEKYKASKLYFVNMYICE